MGEWRSQLFSEEVEVYTKKSKLKWNSIVQGTITPSRVGLRCLLSTDFCSVTPVWSVIFFLMAQIGNQEYVNKTEELGP
jgi:hypothetical protein